MKKEGTEYPGFELWPAGAIECREEHIKFLEQDGQTNFWIGFGWGMIAGIILLTLLLILFFG
jgi:hypothetical protein